MLSLVCTLFFCVSRFFSVCSYCPGGGRVWPSNGYWSYGEYSPPIRCPIEEACPGLDPNIVQSSGAATTVTQICSSGYEGPRCSQCSSSYYQLNSRCYYCGDSTDQSRDIAITLIVALLLMWSLALAVALLTSRWLSRTIQTFVVLQGLAMIGVEGAKSLPVGRQKASAAL
jgi:hypothetical protein